MCASRQHMSTCKNYVRNSRATGNGVFITYLGLLNLSSVHLSNFLSIYFAFWAPKYTQTNFAPLIKFLEECFLSCIKIHWCASRLDKSLSWTRNKFEFQYSWFLICVRVLCTWKAKYHRISTIYKQLKFKIFKYYFHFTKLPFRKKHNMHPVEKSKPETISNVERDDR